MKNKVLTVIFVFSAVFLLVAIALKPEICKEAAVKGILLCGRVLIPSLFPFTACVLFITKSGVISAFERLSNITEKVFGLNAYLTFVVILSFIGGYPIGAKLLNEAVKNRAVTPKRAGEMLNYCINAGPAFIVGAVGNGILGSTKIGYILLISHILASLIIMLVTNKKEKYSIPAITENQSISECFVQSVSAASDVCVGICGYVLFFSVLTAYFDYFSKYISVLKYFPFFAEVTSAIPKAQNIFEISFLLGFSGICVWCQIFSVAKNIDFKFSKFALFRILHGVLSCILTMLAVRVIPVSISCISNNKSYAFSFFYSTPALSVSLVIMIIIFFISLFSKKHTGKLIEDVI